MLFCLAAKMFYVRFRAQSFLIMYICRAQIVCGFVKPYALMEKIFPVMSIGDSGITANELRRNLLFFYLIL